MSQRIAGSSLLALSDDFTGCVAFAGECRSVGLPASVQSWNRPPTAGWLGAVVSDTQSRLTSAAEAMTRVRRTVVSALDVIDAEELQVFKRFDSGLRGNIGSELSTMAEVLSVPCVVASAAPALGVSVEGGYHLLNGVPVHETEYGSDPAGPVTSYLPAIVRGPVAMIDLGQVRGGALPALLAEAVRECPFVVTDGTTTEDLSTVARAVASLPQRVLLAGTYGFGAQVVGLGSDQSTAPRAGVLAVVGSMRRASVAQVLHAESGGASVFVCPDGAEMSDDLVSSAVACLAEGRHAILLARHPSLDVTDDWDPFAAPRLAETAAQVCRRITPTAVVLVGGETAARTMDATGALRCRVVVEPWPASALLLSEGGDIDGVLIVTKSGALGDPGWLTEALALPGRLTSGGWATALI